MTTRYFGAPIKRNEDARLLTGQALFVDDVELPGLLHAAFLRSQVAHARIVRIDVTAARKRAGVVAVYQRHDFQDEKRHALETWAQFLARLASGADNATEPVACRHV